MEKRENDASYLLLIEEGKNKAILVGKMQSNNNIETDPKLNLLFV